MINNEIIEIKKNRNRNNQFEKNLIIFFSINQKKII